MFIYILRRFGLMLTVVLGITLIVFSFVRVMPGDPAVIMLGERASVEQVAALREELGLNKPIFLNLKQPSQLFDSQFMQFVGQLAQGDLGKGLKNQLEISDELGRRFPATIELTFGALLFGTLLGLPAGIIASLNRNKLPDNLTMALSLVGTSMPVFWLGLMAVYFFSVVLGWLPPSSRLGTSTSYTPITGLLGLDSILQLNPTLFWDGLRHLILPSMVLGTIPMAIIARMTRTSMLEVLDQDYVRTARAKGLKFWKVVLKHALRNALIPITIVIGLQIGSLLGGAVLTETIFSWPGVGSWLYQGIIDRDYPVIQGGVIFAAIVVSLVNLLVDVSQAFIDPRLHYS